MSDLLVYSAAALAVLTIWMLGLVRLGVFTSDDVRAFRRIAQLRGFAPPRSRLEKAARQLPWLRTLQENLDLERMLALSGRGWSPLGFLGRSVAVSLATLAAGLGTIALVHEVRGEWTVTYWGALLAAVCALLAMLVQLRSRARSAQVRTSRTLEDLLMPVAILTDSRGLQLQDAVRLLSRCVTDSALENLLDRQGWKRLVPETEASTQELYRSIGSAYGLPRLTQIADAQDAAYVGVPEREVYTRLAEAVYRERLAEARAQAARAKVLVTLPVAAMLLPLLLLLGAPALHAITSGLQGG